MRNYKKNLPIGHLVGRKIILVSFSLFLLFLIQIYLDQTETGIYVSLLAVLGAALGIFLALDKSNWKSKPIITLGMIGYCLYYFILPLIVMTIQGYSISRNLNLPVRTFGLALTVFASGSVVFYFYKELLSDIIYPLKQILSTVVKTFFWYKIPSQAQVWLFGLIGIIAGLFASQDYSDLSSGGSFKKILAGYIPYIISPLMFLGQKLWCDTKNYRPVSKVSLCVYVLIVAIVGLVRNSRSATFEGVFTVFILIGLGVASGNITITQKSKKYIIVLLAVSLLIYPVIQRLSGAMLVTRERRAEVSSTELVMQTWETFKDQNAIDSALRARDQSHISAWREEYTGISFFDRLCNVRYLDLSLYWGSKLDENNINQYKKFEIEKCLALFPQPIINMLQIDFDKTYVNSMSSGDFLYYLASGDVYSIGGFRTGSLIGSSFLIFGPFLFVIVLMLVFTAIWITDDILSYKGNSKAFKLSFPYLLILYIALFRYTSAPKGFEGISGPFVYIFRGIPQMLLLYFFGYIATYIVESLVLSNIKRLKI